MNHAFYFRFSERDCRTFTVKFNSNIKNFDDLIDNETFENFATKIEEETGVHDGEGGGNEFWDNFGYSSYEIHGKKRDFTINEWRKFFIEMFGSENVGEILKEEDFNEKYPDSKHCF